MSDAPLTSLVSDVAREPLNNAAIPVATTGNRDGSVDVGVYASRNINKDPLGALISPEVNTTTPERI